MATPAPRPLALGFAREHTVAAAGLRVLGRNPLAVLRDLVDRLLAAT